MSGARTWAIVLGVAGSVDGRPIRSLLQMSETSEASPIARVTKLLTEMQSTLEKDMEEDEGLYDKMKCWCASGSSEKQAEIEASEAKITELEGKIEALTSRTAGELETRIKELEAEIAADKKALDEATALREKQLNEFQGMENDSMQAIENVKAALTVLAKHQDDSFVQSAFSFLSINSKAGKSWHDHGEAARSFDDFMSSNDIFDTLGDDIVSSRKARKTQSGFLQNDGRAVSATDDAAVLRRAMKSANSFLQSRGRSTYMPSYESKSGEIVGIMKTMMEEMHSELAGAQKTEADRVATFKELRTAKTQEIESGEKMAEKKEDELANGGNDLAEAKEDLGQEKKVLEENQQFVKNLTKMCGDADAAFAERKLARMQEIKAVTETIGILTSDDAKDTISATYKFMQVSSNSERVSVRSHAAATLRRAAAKSRDVNLAMLATTVELDAFTKVKKAINDMITALKQEQADEVKTNDYCKTALQDVEMTTAKTNARLEDLQAKQATLQESIKALEQGIVDAHNEVSEMQTNLQRASEDRKAENMEFQQTIADQATTREILKKALDKLATFYDKDEDASLLQRGAQTPPVPQAEYKPNAGASGVMQMIEKLVQDAHKMTDDAKKGEAEAQAAYEQNIIDTNNSVDALTKEIGTKSKNKAKAKKDLVQTEADILDTVKELEGLSKENAAVHGECDYVLKNFDVRQKARGEEVEALQQATSILNGANLS